MAYTGIFAAMNNKSLLQWLTRIGYAEGVSFLLLLGIAMPLKYIWDMPEAVRYTGMAHGFLFMAYVYWVVMCGRQLKWSVGTIAAGIISSVLPFGPFIFDKRISKKYNYQLQEREP